MPHIIVRFYTVPNVRAARYSAGWALLFIAILYTTAPALAAFARCNLVNSLNNKSIEQIYEYDWVNKWEKTGLLKFEDKNGNGVIELTPQKDTSEMTIDRDIMVLSTRKLRDSRPGRRAGRGRRSCRRALDGRGSAAGHIQLLRA